MILFYDFNKIFLSKAWRNIMDKITKQDTILWVNHAIARFNGLDKKQKDLAEALGIEETRLSEMKGGKGTISPNLMEKVVDLCGAPKRGKGRFEYAEIYNSLNAFLEKYDSVSTNRFHHRLIKALSRKNYTEKFLNNVFLAPETLNDQCSETRQAFTINLINEVIHSSEFNDICVNYREALKSPNDPNFGWTNHSPQNSYSDIFIMKGLIVKEKEVFHALYLQWLLIQTYPEHEFPFEKQLAVEALPDSIPIVITGERILTLSKHSLDNSSLINRHSVGEFGPINNHHELLTRYYFENEICTKPEYWEEVRCDLYLGEAMNYHLLIHLAPVTIGYHDPGDETDTNKWEAFVNKEDRVAVIANINPLSLLNDMEELRKWCGLASDNHYELKQNIAKAGGYVPGARVLV